MTANFSWGPVMAEISNAVATIRMDDQARRNALGPAMVAGLRQAVDTLADPALGVRAAILTGVGRAFSSGGDMAESDQIASARRQGENAGLHYTLESHHHPLLRRLRELPFPLVTAINGPAIGMGMSYALMGDLIVAARSAYFVAGFVKVGMTPDAGLSWNLPRLVGNARARQLMLLGDKLTAEQALAWGMINQVADDAALEAEAQALAARLAAGPPLALAGIRALSWQSWHHSHEEHIDAEERIQMRLGKTDDGAEGFKAFLEKRAPRFTGT
jgi:2-(1,2-epoxy-1,2-dihydrophenyl)acetyl-CoA isomerase